MEFQEVEVDAFEQKPREYKGGPKGPKPRTEEQKPWDAAFDKAWKGNKVLAVQVAPDQADDARKRVDSAARFFGLATTEGAAKPGNKEGTVILQWLVRERKVRGPQKTAESSSE
jgi:hypothetical protein